MILLGTDFSTRSDRALRRAILMARETGDEIRRIDWKAFGRVDRYYIKRFEDETEMATYLVVDASASMLSPGKGGGIRGTSWAMPAALLGAWTMAHLCDELQIDFEVALFNRGYAAQTGFSLISARWDELGGPRGQTLESEIRNGQRRLTRLRTEPWRRWAGARRS